MLVPYGLVTLSWLVFMVVWIVSAFSAKRSIRRGGWGLGIRVIIVLVILILYQSTEAREFLFERQGYLLNPTIQWFGAIICICGVAFAIWARYYLGRNWGMPMSLKKNAELVTSGPYAYVRHPIYTGMLTAMLGTTLVIIWWIVPLVAFLVYFTWAAKTEEKIMLNEFPVAYPDYMKRTKMLIPFVF